ncbi:DUF883 C-terminal domain-containing protein [Asticcacaulis sp. AC402]|uniref:DUF883 C-terminal domain-containing protein n=1 Tax=Asticcacaulis sp. AC402 TaxID=1282361 RepID=UPI0003C3CC4D|nr:DUF883 C-terminal domain-containing protein [Asticcacaulis sp. AC402]ESQ77135.1 hypothetical protein ABAC402_01685 [Asticcacaulis sp. AC402]
MLSEKAQAAAAKITSLNEVDLKSLSESIRHEVEHATHVLGERAKEAEIKVRQFADTAGEDFSRMGRDARRTVEEHPVPTALIALGVGFAVGLLIAGTSRR